MKLEATLRIELRIKDLQSSALPLGYVAIIWSGKRDSNSRPPPWQGDALPTELFPQVATRRGLEPLTSAVTGRHSNQLNYRAVFTFLPLSFSDIYYYTDKVSACQHLKCTFLKKLYSIHQYVPEISTTLLKIVLSISSILRHLPSALQVRIWFPSCLNITDCTGCACPLRLTFFICACH